MIGDALSHKQLEPASFPQYLALVQRFKYTCYTRDVVSGVFATATWLAGWLAVRHTPVLYQNG